MADLATNLAGKTILVTGASRGIGAAITGRLLQDGANVVAHYNSGVGDIAGLAAEFGKDRLLAVQAELSDRRALDELWLAAVEWQNGIDGLVNNAALMDGVTPEADAEAWRQGWDRVMAVNLTAVADLCRHAILHFKTRDGGAIVNIASRAAFRGDLPDSIHYAASKGGVVALTRSIAKGYASENILAYIVAPGWVATERVMPKLTAPGNERLLEEIPMGSAAPPEEVANIVGFLLAGKARHATGSTIDINGASYFH